MVNPFEVPFAYPVRVLVLKKSHQVCMRLEIHNKLLEGPNTSVSLDPISSVQSQGAGITTLMQNATRTPAKLPKLKG